MRRNLCRRALCAFLSLVLLVGTCGLAVQAKGLTGINWMASADKGVQPQFTEVPILMYHHLVEEPDDPAIGQDTLWVGQFRRQLELLRKEGYHTVSIEQLIAFATRGEPLPDKPVCLTFDDGYSSTYELAFPLLKEFEMKATVFVIGVSVGKDTYKDTGLPMTPHFTWEQAREMADSGLVSLQSHTYDMHQWCAFETVDGGKCLRPNILRQPWETEEEYAQALLADLERSRSQLQEATGQVVTALSYPGGSYDACSEKLLQSYGVQCTLTIHPGKARLLPRVPESLYALNRFYVKPSTTDAELLQWVG